IRTFSSCAYVGAMNKGPVLWPTEDGRWVVENWQDGKLKDTRRYSEFDQAMKRIGNLVDKDKIKVKITKIVNCPTPQAKKYKYKTDTR
ncbi:MAG: hypothetical protein ACOCUR_02340, partial [Nanoarchaeota archaeon]